MSAKLGFKTYINNSLIVFNEQQEAKIGAALQALADQMLPTAERQQLKSKDANCAPGGFCIESENKKDLENELIPQFTLKQKNKSQIEKKPPLIKGNCRKGNCRKGPYTHSNPKTEKATILSINQEAFKTTNRSSSETSSIKKKMFEAPLKMPYVIPKTEFLNSDDILNDHDNDERINMDYNKNKKMLFETRLKMKSFTPKKQFLNSDDNNGKSNIDYNKKKMIEAPFKMSVTPKKQILNSDAKQNNDQDKNGRTNVDHDKLVFFSCPECGVEFESNFEWKLHMETEHQYNTTKWLNMKTIKTDNGKLFYQCLDCNKMLSVSAKIGSLQNHRMSHLPHKEYVKCRLCGRKHQTMSSMYSHIKKFHNQGNLGHIPQKKLTEEYINIFCPICRQAQFGIKSFWDHLSDVHNFDNKIKDQVKCIDEFMFICKLCNEKVHRANIKHHMLLHERKQSFQCTICSKYEDRPNQAMQHIRNHFHYDQNKLIDCEYCDATFVNKKLFLDHCREFHKDKLKKNQQIAINKKDKTVIPDLLQDLTKNTTPMPEEELLRKHGKNDNKDKIYECLYVVKEEPQLQEFVTI